MLLKNRADKLLGNLSYASLSQKRWPRNGWPLPCQANGSLHIPGCMFQILSVVSPVEGQGRRICHYRLGSAKQLGWQGAEKSQEAESLTHELQGRGNVWWGVGGALGALSGYPTSDPKGQDGSFTS